MNYADRFLDLQLELKNELGSTQQHPFSLRIGGIETVLHTWLIPLLSQLKKIVPQIEFDLTIEMTPVLNEQIRRGAQDLIFSAMPATGDGICNETLPAVDMVFVGAASMAEQPDLSISELLAHEIMTFQRGSQPHVALMEKLRIIGCGEKRVHALTSISALTKLAESGFGIATLPLAAAKQLILSNKITILRSELELTPLPMYASYWSSPAAPSFKIFADEAVRFAHNFDNAGRGAI